MKKYIITVVALAVLCAGMAACGMSQNTETSSGTPDSSSTVSSAASSEPEPGSTSVTDSSDIAKAESVVADQIKEKETAGGTEPRPEGQVNVSQDKVDAAHSQAVENFISQYMEETGASREEAEAWWQDQEKEAAERNEEAAQKREELAAQREEEEEKAFDAAMDQWYLEHTGMTADQFGAMSIQEKTEWIRQHPDVDFSTNPQHTWNWQH